mmetsp:Transcript_85978/g.199911  ORF Transcript_85978/g.199911 Transcript_85978/m.199911 type:complete len:261 (+) Transcript_85978:1166-1948(+)
MPRPCGLHKNALFPKPLIAGDKELQEHVSWTRRCLRRRTRRLCPELLDKPSWLFRRTTDCVQRLATPARYRVFRHTPFKGAPIECTRCKTGKTPPHLFIELRGSCASCRLMQPPPAIRITDVDAEGATHITVGLLHSPHDWHHGEFVEVVEAARRQGRSSHRLAVIAEKRQDLHQVTLALDDESQRFRGTFDVWVSFQSSFHGMDKCCHLWSMRGRSASSDEHPRRHHRKALPWAGAAEVRLLQLRPQRPAVPAAGTAVA